MPLKVTLLGDNAKTPSRAGPDAASYRLYSSVDAHVIPHSALPVPLNLLLGFPDNTAGQILPDFDLAAHSGIVATPTIIDGGCLEPIYVHLFNHSDQIFHIKKGDLVARLIVQQITTPVVEEKITSRVRINGCSAHR